MQDMNITRLDPRFKFLRKFGYNPEVDSGGGTAAADVWDYGTPTGTKTYPFPTAVAATTIVSDNDGDGGTAAGAQIVRVEGLDANWMELAEEVQLDGTNPVTLERQFLRVHRAYVITPGTDASKTNLGNIDIKHSTTVLARISATRGQTLMAIYTVPANYVGAYAIGYTTSVHRATLTAAAEIVVMMRHVGEAWRARIIYGLMTTGNSAISRELWIPANLIPPKTDIKVRCEWVSANDVPVSAEFFLALQKK